LILCQQLAYSNPRPHRGGRRRGACDALATNPPNSEAQFASIVGAARVLTLIQRATRRRRNGPEQLFKDHSRQAFIGRHSGFCENKEDAEDALQDCWLSVCTNLKSFEGRSSF